ncbi:MAG: hypothetical protein Q7K26_01395 [bacterium]|nr:hypothetical protein [bacterium]
MPIPKNELTKTINPEIAANIRDLAVQKRNLPSNAQSGAVTLNPTSIHFQQQQLAAKAEKATNGNRAEVAETAISGMEAMSGASCAFSLASAGIAVLGALDMISTPIDIAPRDSLAISPEDQLDPATAMIPR